MFSSGRPGAALTTQELVYGWSLFCGVLNASTGRQRRSTTSGYPLMKCLREPPAATIADFLSPCVLPHAPKVEDGTSSSCALFPQFFIQPWAGLIQITGRGK